MRLCPRCTKVLEGRTIADVRLDVCPGCGGAWFDEGELTKLAKTSPEALEALDDQYPDRRPQWARTKRPAECPECSVRLVPFEFRHFPGIPADGCRRCKGIWLDDGELREICQRIRGRQP